MLLEHLVGKQEGALFSLIDFLRTHAMAHVRVCQMLGRNSIIFHK